MSEPEVQKPSKKTRKRAKHTPGPWYQVGAWVEHADDKVADICTCNPEDIGQGHLGRTHQEMVANATLIAAAPDMLKALKSCLSMMRSGDYDFKDVVYYEVERAVNLAIGGYK